MAKKIPTKTTSTPEAAEKSVRPAAAAPAPPKRLIATARPPAGRANKAAPAAKDATPPAAAPARGKTPSKAVAVIAPPAAAAPDRKAPAPAVARKPATKTSRKAPTSSAEPSFTHDDIAVRAYLISEKRAQHGHHAEPHEDWAEAERQLRDEFAATSKRARR